MAHSYLMNIATALYFICYIPELYANYRNKNANIYNVPEKVVIFIGTSFALAYSVVNMDIALITNYAPIMILDTAAMLMRIYYVYKNDGSEEKVIPPECHYDKRDSAHSS